jgi:hypothetical protein
MPAIKQQRRNISGLRPFQPGQSGNPGGRPKKLPITDVLREQLTRTIPVKTPKGMTADERIARALIKKAVDGDLRAIAEIADRTEGKATERHEWSGPDGGPIPFELPGTREEVERRIQELLAKGKPRK